jgi:hypothetical protein
MVTFNFATLLRHTLLLLLLTLVSSSTTLLRHSKKDPSGPTILQNDGQLAGKRPILESNPSNGEKRFPKRNPFTHDPEKDQKEAAPPLPFSQTTSDNTAYGISSVDTGRSFPIGSAYSTDAPYQWKATPPEGVPNQFGVTQEQDDAAGDTSAPDWQNQKPAAAL